MGWLGFCLHLGFKLSVNKGKEQRMKSLTKHTWVTYFQQGAAGVYRLHSWHKSTCFFCGLTVFFYALVDIYATLSVCVCVYMQQRACVDVRVLRTHGPGLGSHDCKQSQGQNHAALKQLSHHSPL